VFVTVDHLRTSLIFAGKAKSLPYLGLHSGIEKIMAIKSFIVHAPGEYIIKLFTAIIY
jgi:hypothetical protein